jgi:hypothetical protein
MPRVWRLAATASLIVGLAAAGIAAHVLRDGGSKTFQHGASGIALDRPDGWAIQTFGRYCMRVGPGLLVSNVARHRFRNIETPTSCTNGWDLSGLPKGFVLLDASFMAYPLRVSDTAETRMPLSLSRFRKRPSADYGGCGKCARSVFGVVRGRRVYTVRVWLGSEASADDRRELEHVVRTLRFGRPNA